MSTRITESRLRSIIKQELKIVLKEQQLKKVNWENFRSLDPKEREFFNDFMKGIKPSMNKQIALSKEYQKAIISQNKEESTRIGKEWKEAGDEYGDLLLKYYDIFTKAGYEPPEVVASYKTHIDELDKQYPDTKKPSQQQNPNEKKEPLVVWIRDEKGNLVKVPELEGLRYFQNMAKQTQEKAKQAEEELNALRKANDEQLKAYREELKNNLKTDLDLYKAVYVIYTNIMIRLLKKMQEFHANRDEKNAKALADLTKNIDAAYSQLDLVKLQKFEKNISSWA